MDEVNLSNCDREPIHLIGSVQSFGCLFAFSTDWILVHVSDNCESVVGTPPDQLLGQRALEFLAPDAVHSVRNRLQWLHIAQTAERLTAIDIFGDGDLYDVAMHLSGDLVVLEVEKCQAIDQLDALNVVRAMTGQLQRVEQVDDFLKRAARQIRFVTDFDRVMVYRFLDDGTGEVVAESLASGMDSFLGLRYPASDIPAQARELYLRNLVRLIADVGDTGARVVSLDGHDDTPFDMSLSTLRTVSPIHIEYLRNMDVGASFSISIIINEKLWGLFACHNRSPKTISFQRRVVAELFSQMFSLDLASRLSNDNYASEAKGREIHDRIIASLPVEGSIFDKLSDQLEQLRQAIPCDGIALSVGDEFASIGDVVREDEATAIAKFLSDDTASEICATSELSRLYPYASRFEDRISGVLYVPVSRHPRDYLMFVRGEVVRSVTWAGNPDKPVENGPDGGRLSPRKSFEAWREVKRGTSVPWTTADIRIAETLRTTLLEVILLRSEHGEQQMRQAQLRQEVLIRELNHRVRNILSLIRAIVNQTGEFADDSREFTQMLDKRVQALARAHDQLTQENWAASSFRTLLNNEIEAYLEKGNDRIATEGPAVLLNPQAYTCLALVFHELFTNAAKYGSLAYSRGRVQVSWHFDDDNSLVIAWCETGGPPVVPPSRSGFGSTIIERSIPYDLDGQAGIAFNVSGVTAEFVIPSRFLRMPEEMEAEEATPMSDRSSRPEAPDQPIPVSDKGAVLLVEDNVIIAMDAENMLREVGYSEVFMSGTVNGALEILERQRPAAAVLDINLGDETSLPVADRLLDAGISFVFASGYGDPDGLPARFHDMPVITKPYTANNLRALAGYLDGG